MNCKRLRVAAIGVVAILCAAADVSAQTAPALGSAEGFAVLGASTVTNTGLSTVTGELGVSPGTAVTGFGPGVVAAGSIHSNDALAMAAHGSLLTAYNDLAVQPCTTNLTGQDLGGLTLTPGVYCFDSSAQLTGLLTLDAQGDPNAVFIFQIGSTLTTASVSSVVMINTGSFCNVFWQVGSSATLGTGTAFGGSILAVASITLTTGSSVTGRALAANGAVTMDTNAVTVTCPTGPPPMCPAIALSPATLPDGTVAVAYSQTIGASGGMPPYSFVLTGGALPTGTTLTPAGVLAGTPTTAATFNFTIRGTDANACVATIAYTVIIVAAPPPPPVCPVIALSPATLANGTVAVAYNQTLVGSGGLAPYSFGVTSGAPPAGVTLTAAGGLSGTPSSAGTFAFTIRGADANGCFATRAYTVVIAAAPPPPPVCPIITVSPATLPDGIVAAVYSQMMVGSGGMTPYSFGLSSGALPAGTTLTAAGVLAGTPTTAGTSTFTIRGTDANGCFATRFFTLSFTLSMPAPVPTLPQAFGGLLALGLAVCGYVRLRRVSR